MTARIDILLALIERWNSDQNIDAVLEFLTDDIVWHFAAVSQPPNTGKNQARKFLEVFSTRVRSPRWRVFAHAELGDRLFVEGVDAFDTPDGRAVTIPYIGVYEFRGDRICGWRDYFDSAAASRSTAGEALPAHAQLLADRAAVTLGKP